jgi:glycosyltransferase involved in cell wall biosynthesis
LLSESDFTDITQVRRTGLAGGQPAKRWDVIYVCCPNGFNERTKNWRLAKLCLTRLSEELGTTALLVGRKDAPDVPDVPGIETTDELPWDELMGCLAQARTLLVPNRLDASPVLLTEALCLDVPVVVNRRILGGWKYVVAETGRFFTDEQDVTDAVAACLRGDFATSAWFRTFYGPDNAGRRLAEFLRSILRAEQSGTQRSLPAWRHAHLASQIP